MNQPLIDNSILALAFLTAILIVRFSAGRRLGWFPSFLLLFAPLVIFFNMWGHTIAVLIVNYKRYLSGSFQYGFHFYSLLLFGIVFIGISGLNIHWTRCAISGDKSQRIKIHGLNAITTLLFLPLFLINPIALLPVMASAVSSLTLVLAKSESKPSVILNKENLTTAD
jgi:hypothetical protein